MNICVEVFCSIQPRYVDVVTICQKYNNRENVDFALNDSVYLLIGSKIIKGMKLLIGVEEDRNVDVNSGGQLPNPVRHRQRIYAE